jgi:hypothetical protein
MVEAEEIGIKVCQDLNGKELLERLLEYYMSAETLAVRLRICTSGPPQ